MDNSRVGEGVAYSETSRWKAVSFRKRIAKAIAKAILVNWPQAVEGSTSLIMGSAERIEENVFASAKDEADYKLNIRIWIRSLDTSSMIPRRKPSATSCNISEAATSSGSNERVADVDWQEVLYQKVQMLRSELLPILSDLYRCFIFELPNIKQTQIERLPKTKNALDGIFTCLNVAKSQIGPDFESKLDEKKRQIGSFVRIYRAYLDKKGQHSTDKCSTQQAVPSQSSVFEDKLSEKQLTIPSMSLQISHLLEQIPNENKMNPQVKSTESEQDDLEKLMQQVAEEYDISLDHEVYALIDTDESDTDSVSPQVKCPTNEEKRTLLEEIKEVKMLLLDVELVFNEADIIPSMAPGASGLIVELRFIGVTINSDFMSHLASNQMSIKPLRLRIPTNYPNSSPILLDEMSSESSNRAVDLSTKAKLKLQHSLRSLDDPLSIKSIALSWEECVSAAMFAYHEESGVGKFGFRYGGWRNF